MRALEGTPAEAALLSPPTLEDIAQALRSSDADLLAYLLPQQENGGGMATGMSVLVDRQGAVRWIPLPRLRAGRGSMTADFLRARQAAENPAGATEAELRGWRKTLDTVCDWAWGAAIGPLLATASARSPAAGPPRIVLIPAGQLGLIPWHAARLSQGGSPPRYACQDAIFSYASSARQFIEASRRRPRPWPQSPVLISDSGWSLPNAALEIAHLYDDALRRRRRLRLGARAPPRARPRHVAS